MAIEQKSGFRRWIRSFFDALFWVIVGIFIGFYTNNVTTGDVLKKACAADTHQVLTSGGKIYRCQFVRDQTAEEIEAASKK